MLDVLSLMWKVIFAPLWILWRLYGLLWWAFGEGSPPVTASLREEIKGASFEVVDSRPAPTHLKKPVGALRGGFIGSLAASGVYAIAAHNAADMHWLTNPAAWGAWLWATAVTFVASIYAVRHVAKRHALREAARAQSPIGRAKAAVASSVGSVAAAATKARPAWCFAKASAGKGGAVCFKAARCAWTGAQEAAKAYRRPSAQPSPAPTAPSVT